LSWQVQNKSAQVRTDSFPGHPVPQHSLSVQSGQASIPPEQTASTVALRITILPFDSIIARWHLIGIAELGLGIHPLGRSASLTSTTVIPASGVAQSAFPTFTGQSGPPNPVSGTLVGPNLFSIWGTTPCVPPRLHHVYGCLQPWLGSQYERYGALRNGPRRRPPCILIASNSRQLFML
jgi:hypothetical protein